MVMLSSSALAPNVDGGFGTTVSSRSDSKVDAYNQPVEGPDPFTVRADTFTWYCLPLFKPEMA